MAEVQTRIYRRTNSTTPVQGGADIIKTELEGDTAYTDTSPGGSTVYYWWDHIWKRTDGSTFVTSALHGPVTVSPTPEVCTSPAIELKTISPPPLGCDYRVNYETKGAESVKIEKRVALGAWQLHQNTNVPAASDNCSPTRSSNWLNVNNGEECQFRVTPYPQDGQAGTPGTTKSTGQLTCSGPE